VAMSELVARVASSRDPAVVYQVNLDGAVYTCSCPGFGFRKSCRHVKALAELRAIPVVRRTCNGCGSDSPMEWDAVLGRWQCGGCSKQTVQA